MVAEAKVLPAAVEQAVEEIADTACQVAFALIGARLELLGYPVTGDFTPNETLQLDEAFRGYVRAMALNNPAIGALQETG